MVYGKREKRKAPQKKKDLLEGGSGVNVPAVARAATATGPTAAERHAEAPAGAADATEMYKRISDWYNSPEGDALRAAWGRTRRRLRRSRAGPVSSR